MHYFNVVPCVLYIKFTLVTLVYSRQNTEDYTMLICSSNLVHALMYMINILLKNCTFPILYYSLHKQNHSVTFISCTTLTPTSPLFLQFMSLVENMVKKNRSRFAITVLLTTVLSHVALEVSIDCPMKIHMFMYINHPCAFGVVHSIP